MAEKDLDYIEIPNDHNAIGSPYIASRLESNTAGLRVESGDWAACEFVTEFDIEEISASRRRLSNLAASICGRNVQN